MVGFRPCCSEVLSMRAVNPKSGRGVSLKGAVGSMPRGAGGNIQSQQRRGTLSWVEHGGKGYPRGEMWVALLSRALLLF